MWSCSPPSVDSPNFPCDTRAAMLLLLPGALKLCSRQTCTFMSRTSNHSWTLFHIKNTLHSLMACVLSAVSQIHIWEPLFFRQQDQNLLIQFISLFEESERDCCIQHDGATVHISNTTASLQEFFCQHIGGHGLLPLWSPNIMFCVDFSKSLFKKLNAACRKWNTLFNRLLPVPTHKHFTTMHIIYLNLWKPVFEKVVPVSAYCVKLLWKFPPIKNKSQQITHLSYYADVTCMPAYNVVVWVMF